MDVREKLVELMCDVLEDGCIGHCNHPPCWKVTHAVDGLIAHGVTVQELDGCEYCQQFDDPCGVPMIAEEESETDRGIYLYNGFLCANGGEFCEAKVNFCPMCGRKLPQPPKGE